jgi:hypothetical protein
MSKYTDSVRAAILRRSASSSSAMMGNPVVSAAFSPAADLPPEEDALERWNRLRPKPEWPPRERYREQVN